MSEIINIGGLSAAPGQRVHGFISIGNGRFSLPATIVRGEKPGKTALITAGIHAGEYVGIQSAVELGRDLKIEIMTGTVIIVKVVAREEFENRHGSLCRATGENLNRLFPGKKEGTTYEKLAYAVVEELQKVADFYIDLHSGDDYEKLTPYVYYAGKAAPEVMKISRQMAEQVDVPYMVKSEVSSGGSYNYAASCGIPSVLLERGGMGDWDTEDVRSMKRDVRCILRFLGIYDGHASLRKYYPLNVTQVQYQSASYTGMWYPQKKAGDLFTEGEILGYVKDYEDNILENSVAYGDGVIIYQAGSLQVLKDGPMVAYGRISYEEDDRKEKIAAYWTKRSDSFLEQRRAELHSALADRWLEEIRKNGKLNYLNKRYFGKHPAVPHNTTKYTLIKKGDISQFDKLFRKESKKLGWDWRLLAALVYTESQFDPYAESEVGAYGLMQIIPETADHFNVGNYFEPDSNVYVGTEYLHYLDRYFSSQPIDSSERLKFVLAAYNAGPGHVLDAIRLANKNG